MGQEIWNRSCCFASIGAMLSLVFAVVLFCPLLTSSKNAIKANVDPLIGRAFQSDQNLKTEPAPQFETKDICGDPECDLVCAEGQECRPTGDQCVMPPCCVVWHCVDTSSSRMLSRRSTLEDDECPPEWPEMGESCSSKGISCEYGWEICCGERVPDVIFSCEEGSWQMIWVDSLCDIGLPCPTTTTTGKGFN